MRGFLLRVLVSVAAAGSACSPGPEPAPSPARDVVLVTIDTLRADRVGAYGWTSAATPALDALARDGVRFDRAWAPAPITLPSHASLLSGRYPPRHLARHNGIAMTSALPTLATALKAAGFATAAFVSAFPLDRRFGLQRGFDRYDDELPRAPDGRPLNERAGHQTVARAVDWLTAQGDARVFLWVHLFEPHAPYGDPAAGPADVSTRYDAEVAAADRAVGQLMAALAGRTASTLVVAAADHGEAFGEHGELGHSLFVYDTTLRVPLIMRGPSLEGGRRVDADVSLVDVAPTVLALAGVTPFEADGRSLVPVLRGASLPSRAIYAESMAPLVDFGWADLRAVRDGRWKYIAAPRAELYDVAADPIEGRNLVSAHADRAETLGALARTMGRSEAAATTPAPDSRARLQSLGYLSGGGAATPGDRPDPKDRVELAARLASVMAGEVRGASLVATLEAILRDDPRNPQAHLRLGYAHVEEGRCSRAEPHLRAALEARMPSADAGLGLARCRASAGDPAGAAAALEEARAAEPGNPVVVANLGALELGRGQTSRAILLLREALDIDANLHQARFTLARALARSGDRAAAAAQARELLRRLPPGAPQRAEVERLLAALH